MRLSTLFGSALLLSVVCFAVDASAQGIKVGSLKKLTAPMTGGLELMAIGYDGDTTESEEKPSLYGVRNMVGTPGDEPQLAVTLTETEKPSKDCINCELRDAREELSFSEQFADIRRY